MRFELMDPLAQMFNELRVATVLEVLKVDVAYSPQLLSSMRCCFRVVIFASAWMGQMLSRNAYRCTALAPSCFQLDTRRSTVSGSEAQTVTIVRMNSRVLCRGPYKAVDALLQTLKSSTGRSTSSNVVVLLLQNHSSAQCLIRNTWIISRYHHAHKGVPRVDLVSLLFRSVPSLRHRTCVRTIWFVLPL